MDFGSLLQTAKQNEHSNKKDVRYYNTKFSAPKKVEKKDKTLSANIQKFLARKEEEERQKTREANRKKEELLALRSKDKKATRRVNVMLKRTKSANQSVIQDAVDKNNTAVTLVGPSQPDEDDYGYVSQEAAAFYNKMMEKYSKMPDDPKFPTNRKKASSNLSNTKDRVRAALEREKEEAMLPHRRKRKQKEDGDQLTEPNLQDDYDDYEPPVKTKPKLPPPPAMNFSDLLKLAEQKQHEPIMIEVKPKEDSPLLTKKQKRELERLQQRKTSKEQQDKPSAGPGNATSQTNRIPKISSAQINDNKVKNPSRITNSNESIRENGKVLSNVRTSNKSDDRMPKFNNNNNSMNKSKPAVPSGMQNSRLLNGNTSELNRSYNKEQKSIKDARILKASDRTANTLKSQVPKQEFSSNRNSTNLNKSSNNIIRKDAETRPLPSKISDKTPLNMRNTPNTPSKLVNKPMSSGDGYKKDVRVNGNVTEFAKQRSIPGNIKPKEFSSKDIQPKRFPPDDLRPKQFPPRDLKPKQFPPSDVRPRDVKRKPLVNKRRIIDDEDEYDSEMDDFIDDGPEDGEDYSKYIKDIFGYDKSRYRAIDDDDIEEATFAQQMREDVRSTKIGIMEDLEDIKREKEEKRRKLQMKKRR